MKKLIGLALVASVALAAPAVVPGEADAKPSVMKRIKAKTRSNAMNTYGYIYAFRTYDCMKPIGGVWSCDWTGRKDGWRVDGSTYGLRSHSGRLHDVVSVMDT